MKATIDKAGRLVIPKELRARLGLGPGEVELFEDGAALRLEPLAGDDLVEQDGLLMVPPAGVKVTAEDIRALREADQR